MPDSTRPSAVVVDTSDSPFARLKPAPLTAVTLADNFWAPRRRINREVTLPVQYRLLEETGRLDNLRRAAGQRAIPFKGYCFNDSDVYKWLEAAAWSLASGGSGTSDLAHMADTVIELVASAQQPDGYLDSYYAFERAAERWTNLRDMHEMYCAGHLIQAAVAHRRATGSARLLGVARRLADHIGGVFGPAEAGKRPGTPGHPEIEMALVELTRATGEPRYRRLAQFLLDARGRGLIGGRVYHVDHRPLREMERLAGHAVRALYLCAGAADLYAESGEAALGRVLDRLWGHMATHQLYISGGLGSRHEGESFGDDYELPNARAYAETCAAIASVMWNWRMLALDGQARYADLLETTLYNAVLPGLSLDGMGYFYENPLTSDGASRRQPWFDCACCPPNVARLLACLPGLFYGLSTEGVWVHLYAEGMARLVLLDGRRVTLVEQTRYPWDGEVTIEVDTADGGPFSLFLRIPAWCDAFGAGAALDINSQPFDGVLAPGSYAEICRTWRSGDQVRLRLPLPVQRVECHPYAAENSGRVALKRGPILYCIEGTDNPGVDPRDVVLPADGEWLAAFEPSLLLGVVALRGPADVVVPAEGWEGRLYRSAVQTGEKAGTQARIDLTAIPYYAWANRQPGPMQVWLRTEG